MSSRRMPRRRRRRSIAGLVVVASAFGPAAILTDRAADRSSSAPAVTAALATAGRSVGPSADRAPDFTVRTLDGRRFRLSAQTGKVVVFDFLLPGCGECEIEAPSLERAARRFGARRARVLILDLAGVDDKLLRSYFGSLGLQGVLVAGDGARVARSYGVHALGTTVIVGRDGTVRWRGSWVGDEGKLFARIGRALS